jgi:hypothetical protein
MTATGRKRFCSALIEISEAIQGARIFTAAARIAAMTF